MRDQFEHLVQAMTNHERSQWARAGYPGLHRRELEQLAPYAAAAARRLVLRAT